MEHLIEQEITSLLDISVSARNSVGFEIPSWTRYIGVFVPDFAVADNIRLAVSRDGGTTYVGVAKVDGTDYKAILATGKDPMYVNLTEIMQAFFGDSKAVPYKFRFERMAADETTSDKTYYVVVRG